jgi:predicted metal-dependent HD superfamily phosphohydrolase
MRIFNPGFKPADFAVFKAVEKSAFRILRNSLERSRVKLYYHAEGHTKSVVEFVLSFGKEERLESRRLLLVAVAALFHDTGYFKSYHENEYYGARRAQKILEKYGFTTEEIKTVTFLIMATELDRNMRAHPKNIMQAVICDADLAYLGFSTQKYLKMSGNLKREWDYKHKKEGKKRLGQEEWLRLQIRFLNRHEYFTDAAKRFGDKQKQKNIWYLEEKLEELRKRNSPHYEELAEQGKRV